MARGGTHVEQHSVEDVVGQDGSSDEEQDHERERMDRISEDGGDEKDKDGGWADTMAKILGKKTPNNKNILVKSKALEKMKETRRTEEQEKKKLADRKRLWEMMCREKPNIVKDREAERVLQKIATRGVVQLFNSVRKHQKTTADQLREVGGSERKKSKILSSLTKREFISVLRRSEEGNGDSVRTEKDAPDPEEKPAWNVLREDFMMEATMKDWDREDSDPQT